MINDDLVDVDKILEFHLKKERISFKDMTIVHTYLCYFPNSDKTRQLAVLQVFNNLHKCTLIDIGLAI